MVTNSSMTHYHKTFNPETRLEEWVRINYGKNNEDHIVMFQGGKGSSLNKGYVDANDVKIRIPYSKNNNANINNFKIGDIVVKGTIDLDITKQSDLSNYDTFNITSIIDNNFGTIDIQHIHLEGK